MKILSDIAKDVVDRKTAIAICDNQTVDEKGQRLYRTAPAAAVYEKYTGSEDHEDANSRYDSLTCTGRKKDWVILDMQTANAITTLANHPSFKPETLVKLNACILTKAVRIVWSCFK